jgi:hypothetical protein
MIRCSYLAHPSPPRKRYNQHSFNRLPVAEQGVTPMNFETLDDKKLQEVERLLNELTQLIHKAKLTNDPIYEALITLRDSAGLLRRKRFDEHDRSFQGY